MKKFLQKTILLFLAVLLLFGAGNALYYAVSKDSPLVAFEVYKALDISAQPGGYTSVLLGDSVARQLFHPDEQDQDPALCYLATTQAILPAGNYILLNNFLKNHPQTRTVYYMARPDNLLAGANFHYTYSYFITPLYREAFLDCLDMQTQKDVENVYGRPFCRQDFVKWMLGRYPKLLEWYNHGLEKSRLPNSPMPDLAIPYIVKMQQLCASQNVEFVLLSSPLPEDTDTASLQSLQEKLESAGVGFLFDRFASSLVYLDPAQFIDGVHLTQSYLNDNRESLRQSLLNPHPPSVFRR